MSIFNRRKKNKKEEEKVETSEETTSLLDKVTGGTGAKKKKDMMSSIMKESVWETVLDDFRDNELFITHKDDDEKTVVHVAMLLDSEDIGGINKKAGRNEAIGSMVESINGGRIRVLINDQLMEDEHIVFIPDEQTVDAMDEYLILNEAPYTLAFVTEDGEVENSGIPVTFDEFANLVDMGGSIDDFLSSKGVDWVMSDAFDEGVEDYYVDDSIDEGYDDEIPFDEGYEDEIPFEDDVTTSTADFDEEVVEEYYGEEDNLEQVDEFGNPLYDTIDPDDGDYMYDDEYDDEFVDDGIEVDAETVPMAVMEDAITRVFYSDDLGLEVTTEPFDAQFLHGNPYIPFEENRGEGWLNNYVSEMARDANLDMERLHQSNLLKARETYYRVISEYCEGIQRELDADDPETQYGQITDALKRDRLDAIDGVDRTVSEKKDELEERWQAKLHQVGEDAARAAKQQYRERFGRSHDDALYRLEPTVKAQIESDYEDAIRDLHAKRRKDASKRLDYGITETLNEVSDSYMKMLEEEQNKYREYRDDINQFIDDHRKEDIAHTQALADELRQSQKADAVMAEYKEKLQLQAGEFESKRLSMAAEIEDIKRKNDVEIRDLQQASEDRLSDMQKQRDKVQEQLDILMDRYSTLDKQKEEEYKARLSESRDENEIWKSKLDSVSTVHKRSNVLLGTMTVVAVIAALALGTIFGLRTNLDDSKVNANTAIEQSFNQRIDKLEKEKEKLIEEKENLQEEADKQKEKEDTVEETPEEVVDKTTETEEEAVTEGE